MSRFEIELLEERVLLSVSVGELEPGVPDYVRVAFQEAYSRQLNWGSPNSLYLGTPFNRVHRWGPGWIQDFSGGRFDAGAGGAIMMSETSRTAYATWGKHWELYKRNPMQATNPPTSGRDWLGYPTSDHRNPSRDEANGLDWYENSGPPADLGRGSVIYFDAGYITWKEGTPHGWWTKTRDLPIAVGDRESDVPSHVTAKFQEAYNRQLVWGEWNATYLGKPINRVHRWANGWIQDFRFGRHGDGAIMLHENGDTAYAIWGKHWELYKQNPMQGTHPATSGLDWLGYPTSDHVHLPQEELGNYRWFGSGMPPERREDGPIVRFERGYITWKAGTPHAWWTRDVSTLTVFAHGFRLERDWDGVPGLTFADDLLAAGVSLAAGTDPLQGENHYHLSFDWGSAVPQNLAANSNEIAGQLFQDILNGRGTHLLTASHGNWPGLSAAGPVNIHLIGHSRGAFVVAEVARLLQRYYDDDPKRFARQIGTIQVTTLDPQPGRLDSDETDSGFDGTLDMPAVVVTSGGAWNYYQTKERFGGYLIPPPTLSSANTVHVGNITLDQVAPGHSAVREWYLKWSHAYAGFSVGELDRTVEPYFHLAFRRRTDTRILLDSPAAMIHPGERTQMRFVVDAGASRIMTSVTYEGSDLDLELIRPDGLRVTHASLPAGTEIVQGPTYEYYSIPTPMAGEWKADIIAVDVPSTGEPFTFTAMADTAARLEGDESLIWSDFSTSDGARLNGAAAVSNGQLYLTSTEWQSSSVWFAEPVTTERFKARFDFEIDQQSGIAWGDGFTFAVVDASLHGDTALGVGGGGLGYEGLSGFAIEFDTYMNAEYGDTSQFHIGLNEHGSVSSSVATAALPFAFHSSGTITAEIVVDASSVEVFLSRAGEEKVLVLTGTLAAGSSPPLARIGFTGTTAAAAQRMTIDNFRLDRLTQSTTIKFHVNAVVYPNHFTQPSGRASDAEIQRFLGDVESALQGFLQEVKTASNGLLQGTYSIFLNDRSLADADYNEVDFGNGNRWLVLKGATIDAMRGSDFAAADAAYAFVMWGPNQTVGTANFYHGSNFISMAGAWEDVATHEFMHLLDDEFQQAGEPGMVHADMLGDPSRYPCITTPEALQNETVLVRNILSYHENCDGSLLDYRVLWGRFGAFSGSLPRTILNPLIDQPVESPVANVVAGAGPGGGPAVAVFDAVTGQMLRSFFAFEPSFRGGISVATSDLNGDGLPEIITGPGPGMEPLVRVFDGLTGDLLSEFLAFPAGFRGGITLATGDVDGDGDMEVIAGARAGGGPALRVFDGLSGAPIGTPFFAFDKRFRGGVNVAVGDVDGDGTDEIIVGAGPGGGPAVRVFDFSTLTGVQIGAEFLAFAPVFRGGVFVSASDLDEDGNSEIVVGAGPGGGPAVRMFEPDGTQIGNEILAFPVGFRGGVHVATADVNGDAETEIIVGAGPGGGPAVRIFDPDTQEQLGNQFFAFPKGFRGGVFVAGRAPGLSAEGSSLTVDPSTPPPADSGPALVEGDLPAIVDAAEERFSIAGLSPEFLATLSGVRFFVTELGDDRLGLARNGTVYLDDDAAGYGWFVDYSPLVDEEFFGDGSQLVARDARASGRIDLLTAVMHELGHVLGLEHKRDGVPGGLMDEWLRPGERRLPGSDDLDQLFADSPALDEFLLGAAYSLAR